MTAVTATGTSSGVFDVWLSNYHWTGPNLTYSFPTDGATYSYMGTGDVTPISASQQAAVHKILAEIASFTGLTFTEVTESVTTQGDIRFGTDTLDSGAYAYLPESDELGGDAFFGPITDNPQLGNESYLYFNHEIGHSMGLNHGHEYPSFVATLMDSQEFTVVTYTDYVGDTNTGSFDSGVIDWAQTYMQLDIAAMQFLYGANYATAGEVWSGDSTYTFSATTGEMSINETGQGTPAGNRIFRTIWDGDGVDTYDLCNYTTALVIDLTPGGWSVFSATQLADLNKNSTDTAFNARGNIANALLVDEDQRALIENAIGGTVGDLLYGNDADNRLVGRGGDDILFGGNSQDTLLGNAGVDTLHGELGDDRLNGGSGGDKLFGNGGQDWLTGKGGTDRLNGGLGKDRLEGGYGKDQLFGKAGNDRMFGDGGEDILVGGLGKDIMFGGLGADTFRFDAAADSESANGIDVIKDFQVGSDVLDLSELVAGPFALSLGGSFTGTGPSVKTVESGGNTSVAADLDGNGTVDFRVTLQGTTGLTVVDFIL